MPFVLFLSVIVHDQYACLCDADAGMKLLLLLLLLTVYAGQVAASIGRCPTGLPSTTAVRVFHDICYQFVSEERYWTGARDYCIQVCCLLTEYG